MQTTKRIWVLAIALVCSLAASAEEEKKHPIDKAYEACMDKNSTTSGMRDCTNEAAEAWDKELNRVYEKLSAKLDEKGREALKAAQRKWIEQRDVEYKLIDAVYSRLEGTMYIPMRAYSRLRIVRERALLLSNYLVLLETAAE